MEDVEARIRARARDARARFRKSYPRTITTAVEPDELNADQFCAVYEYVDEKTRRPGGAAPGPRPSSTASQTGRPSSPKRSTSQRSTGSPAAPFP